MSKLSYKEKTTSTGTMEPERWLMTEYGIQGCDIVIAKIYKSPRSPRPGPAMNVPPPTSTAFPIYKHAAQLQEVESFLMTDAGGALDDFVEYQLRLQGRLAQYSCFTNNDDSTSQAMGTLTLPPPLLAQGTGQYPAAAAPPRHCAGHGHPMVMDDQLGIDADANYWVWLWNQQEVFGHPDGHSLLLPSHHMAPSATATATVTANVVVARAIRRPSQSSGAR